MNQRHLAAQECLKKAHDALARHERVEARRMAEKALRIAPELEEPWLLMAALASPRASVAYLQQALDINPQSERARKGMHWAIGRLRAEQARTPRPVVRTRPAPAIVSRRNTFPAVFVLLLCLVAIWAIFPGNAEPVLAFVSNIAQAAPRLDLGPAPQELPTQTAIPSATPTFTPPPTYTPTQTASPIPTFTATPEPTFTPSPTFTALPSNTPLPSATTVPLESPTSLPPPPTEEIPPTATAAPYEPPVEPPVSGGDATWLPAGVGPTTRWVDVNLTQQMLYAYEGSTLVASFLISSGTWQFPTVTGTYSVWHRTTLQDMSGPGYYVADVPWVMYFYGDYGIHGAWWHNNFGTPMSHGCVNMRVEDAKWLYYWTGYGTIVNVHY